MVNKHRYCIVPIAMVHVVGLLLSCTGGRINQVGGPSQEQAIGNNQDKMNQINNHKGITFADLATISPDKQETYLNQIAHWYYGEWGRYCPDKQLKDFIISTDSLIKGKLPITWIACDTTEERDRLIAVVRLKDDNIEDATGSKVFSDDIYKLSGLYVDAAYRNRGIGRAIMKELLTIASKQYHVKNLGFFSHSEEAQKVYAHCGIPLHSRRKIHDAEAAIYLFENTPSLLQKLSSSLPIEEKVSADQ